jgi:NAD(P)-dependent dehydrogenase (short-subunit alcohol dehydrogenase family)
MSDKPLISEPLNGKTALVTGGARRIGRETALTLARAGANVAITYQNSRHDAHRTASEIELLGRHAVAIECDLRSEESVRAAVAAAVQQFCRLDILVNNAATFEGVPLESMTLAQWDAMFETNTRGQFLTAREALPALRSSHGRIINLGSLGGIEAWAGHAHYSASKAALHSLTQSMAKAFAPSVTVNCVAPGFIEMEGSPEEPAARFKARTPMQRNGTADDIAQAVLFFATTTTFITGQILTVDGGLGLV